MEMYITDCLNSVVHQSYDNIEVIIVNDGSTDESAAICKSFSKKYKNIKIINQENKGLGAARNAGLEHATGEYLAFLDSDDYLHQEFCTVLYNVALNYKVKLVACHEVRIKENGEKIEIDRVSKQGVVQHLSTEDIIRTITCNTTSFLATTAWGKIYHKSLFNNRENRYPIGVYYEDNWLTMKLYLEAGESCLIYNELIYYRYREDSITNTTIKNVKSINDYFTQLLNTIKVVSECNDISKDAKMNFFSTFKSSIGVFFFSYQLGIYHECISNNYYDTMQRFALFGAGIYGKRFYNTLLNSLPSENVVFIDNNIKSKGKKIYKSQVISLEEYIKSYNKYQIIITTKHLFEVLKQLFDENVINNVDEILPKRGLTDIERALKKGILSFINFCV